MQRDCKDVHSKEKGESSETVHEKELMTDILDRSFETILKDTQRT